MLKQRMAAAEKVAADFLTAEKAVDFAATQAAVCVATMLTQRAEANLPVGVGLEALRVISEAAGDMVNARQRFIEAHRLLVEARADIGLRAYGDESECPDDFASPMGVKAPLLAAVA